MLYLTIERLISLTFFKTLHKQDFEHVQTILIILLSSMFCPQTSEESKGCLITIIVSNYLYFK